MRSSLIIKLPISDPRWALRFNWRRYGGSRASMVAASRGSRMAFAADTVKGSAFDGPTPGGTSGAAAVAGVAIGATADCTTVDDAAVYL